MTLFSTFDRMAWSECLASYIFNFDDFDFMDVMCLILLFTQVVLFALFSPGLPLLPYYIQVTDYNIITQLRKILFACAMQRSNVL